MGISLMVAALEGAECLTVVLTVETLVAPPAPAPVWGLELAEADGVWKTDLAGVPALLPRLGLVGVFVNTAAGEVAFSPLGEPILTSLTSLRGPSTGELVGEATLVTVILETLAKLSELFAE